MESFNQLCSEYSWAVSIISTIISALLSWTITVFYFEKSNKKEATIMILEPINNLLNKIKNVDNFNRLEKLANQYAMKYLSPKERKSIDNIISTYEKIYSYNEMATNADIIVGYYHYIMKQHNIKLDIEPIKDNKGNTVHKDIPFSATGELSGDIENIMKNEIDDVSENQEIEDRLNSILNANMAYK